MKFALIADRIAFESYYIKDKIAYDYNNNPYVYHHAYSPECYIAMQNLPFIFDKGYFWNWSQLGELPDVELDIIFVAIEKNFEPDGSIRTPEICVNTLRQKYPNAKILGWIKEVYMSGVPKNEDLSYYDYNDPRHHRRIEFLNNCDAVVTSGITIFKNHHIFDALKKNVNKKFYFISQPVNVNYIFDNFYSNEKEQCIFAYLPNPMHRRGRTYEFADYISKKYNIPVKFKQLTQGQKFDYLSQHDFGKLWSSCAFHFNLDPTDYHPGNQVMQVACAGCINFGGNNESHTILYPETATCDFDVLEKKFVEYLNDEQKRWQAISYAWNKVNEIYSFKTVKSQIEKIYKEL